ncbi:hypothetical protein D3C73_1365970 [compost metagenome]
MDFFEARFGSRAAPLYRTASTGDTLAASLPGLRQLMNTVIIEKRAAPAKIIGLAEAFEWPL